MAGSVLELKANLLFLKKFSSFTPKERRTILLGSKVNIFYFHLRLRCTELLEDAAGRINLIKHLKLFIRLLKIMLNGLHDCHIVSVFVDYYNGQ